MRWDVTIAFWNELLALLHMSSWQLGTWAVNELYLVEFTEIISSTFWALGEDGILWAPKQAGFCNCYSWSCLTCCCTRAVNELRNCRIYWNILDFYELSEKSAVYELRNRRAFVSFILDSPPRAAAHVQFYELHTCKIYWNILDFYELSENSSATRLQACGKNKPIVP